MRDVQYLAMVSAYWILPLQWDRVTFDRCTRWHCSGGLILQTPFHAVRLFFHRLQRLQRNSLSSQVDDVRDGNLELLWIISAPYFSAPIRFSTTYLTSHPLPPFHVKQLRGKCRGRRAVSPTESASGRLAPEFFDVNLRNAWLLSNYSEKSSHTFTSSPSA